MATARPAKHERPASTVSRSPKRVREGGDGTISDTVDDEAMMTSQVPRQEDVARRRGQKRDNLEVDQSTDAGTIGSDEYEDVDTDAAEHAAAATKGRKGAKKTIKAARIDENDSPARLSTKEKRERQSDLKFAGSTKGKGKRVLEDADDHEIGEEWTDLNGLRWRMGEDRQVRREAVVVEMRPKYPSMPKDSRHPDAKVKVPVLVERFLTEGEYEDARSKKLLSFQELDRQREAEEREAAVRKRQEEEEEAKRQRALESGRAVTTPKKIRNMQALFQSARKATPPSRHPLAFPLVRSRSLSVRSESPSTPASNTSVKRLSLNKDIDETKVASPSPMAAPKLSTPKLANTPQKVSYRLPLASPSSPGVRNVSVNGIRGSPVGDVKAKRKREEALLKLLQEEADRRKKREQAK